MSVFNLLFNVIVLLNYMENLIIFIYVHTLHFRCSHNTFDILDII